MNEDCKLCNLSSIDNVQPIYSRGGIKPFIPDTYKPLMVVGEHTSEVDNEIGLPLVGKSGSLLNSMLYSANIDLDDVYITNLVKCHNPNHVRLTTKNYNACLYWYNNQVNTIKPKVVLLLGSQVGKYILGKDFKISQDRGKLYKKDNTYLIPTFSPSYLFRHPSLGDGSPKYKVWQDMLQVKKVLQDEETMLNYTCIDC